MEIQQCKVKSTFPARIAPFSVPLGRMEAVQGLRKARLERETWTYFALLYLHNGRGSYLDFEPLGVLCLVTSARSKGVRNTSISLQECRYCDKFGFQLEKLLSFAGRV
eukprot:Em0014g891a